MAALENWGNPTARKEWLPALASSSDHAWAFWNRANAGNLAGIKRIFSCMITNEITLALIDEALRTYPLSPGEQRPNGVQKWPGNTFPMRYDAAQALLGAFILCHAAYGLLIDFLQAHPTDSVLATFLLSTSIVLVTNLWRRLPCFVLIRASCRIYCFG